MVAVFLCNAVPIPSGVVAVFPHARQPAPDSPRPSDPPLTGPSVSVETRTPYVVDYPGEDGGKMAHYMLRWVTTTGENGPWNELVSAAVFE